MKKAELRELSSMMFPDYPDIVTVSQLQKMLGISRSLEYDLINSGSVQDIKSETLSKFRRSASSILQSSRTQERKSSGVSTS